MCPFMFTFTFFFVAGSLFSAAHMRHFSNIHINTLLISSIPSTNPEEKKEVEDGNANKISNDSKCDCPFAPRCEKFSECCMEYQHRYIEVEPNHFVMCCNKHL